MFVRSIHFLRHISCHLPEPPGLYVVGVNVPHLTSEVIVESVETEPRRVLPLKTLSGVMNKLLLRIKVFSLGYPRKTFVPSTSPSEIRPASRQSIRFREARA